MRFVAHDRSKQQKNCLYSVETNTWRRSQCEYYRGMN